MGTSGWASSTAAEALGRGDEADQLQAAARPPRAAGPARGPRCRRSRAWGRAGTRTPRAGSPAGARSSRAASAPPRRAACRGGRRARRAAGAGSPRPSPARHAARGRSRSRAAGGGRSSSRAASAPRPPSRGSSRAASTARIADASSSAWRNCAVGRVGRAHDRQAVGKHGMVDDDDALGHGRASLLDRVEARPMRNVELKSRDPDPARTLELALALGARDEGEITQRDTYFGGVARAREAARADAGRRRADRLPAPRRRAGARERVPARRGARRGGAEGGARRRLRDARRRRQAAPAAALGGRPHPPRRGRGARLLHGARGAAPTDADLGPAGEKVARLREELQIDDDEPGRPAATPTCCSTRRRRCSTPRAP